MQSYITQKHSHPRSAHRSVEMGFTLVEAIVAAMISLVLLGVFSTILMMNNNGVKDGAVNAQVQSQYDIAIAEIGARVRTAAVVLDGDANETSPPANNPTSVTTNKIIICSQDADGTFPKMRGFLVEAEGGVLKLKECSTGFTSADYIPFKVGSWPSLSVVEATPFQLSKDRKTLTVSMSVTGTFAGITAVAPARGEVFTCRN
jgi:type II secretory pathway pseudopilin PulG